METDPASRRPLKSRSSKWAGWSAGKLARTGVTPNQISAASVVFALAGGSLFVAAGFAWIVPWTGWVGGALCVQARLVCNLLDGMVAIEGGKKSPTGGIWNEVPDRFADTFFLVGAGIGCGHPWPGVLAAWAAVMTAYVRSLGGELTKKQDFCGPGAKPQRMFFLTVGALVTAVLTEVDTPRLAYEWMGEFLVLILVLTVLTIFRRLLRMAAELKKGGAGGV